MNFKRERIFVIIGAIVIIGLAIGLPFCTKPDRTLLPNFALSQLAFSAVAFFIVFLALYFTIIQLRKSMAKPLIKVAFNKNGEQQANLIYKDGKLITGLPPLWLINEGNAVARYFQIDFIIPEYLGKQSQYVVIVRDDGKYIYSYTNDGKYTLFVNKPYQNIGINVAIDNKNCLDKDSFEIKYRIYGDWAETQEGKLKVSIIKQEEAPDARS